MMRIAGKNRAIGATNARKIADLDRRIELLLAATRRERDLTAGRASATQTRATLLVGASGLVASGPIVAGGPWWIPVGCFAFAALLGIWALVPDSAKAIRTQEMWSLQASYTSTDLHEQILKDELAADTHAADLVKRRSILVVVGFILFALGVGVSATQLVATTISPSPAPTLHVKIVE